MSDVKPPSSTDGKRFAIVGGRLEDDNSAVYDEMHRMTGGRILVFPTASSEPEAVGAETAEVFRSHGFEVEIAAVFGADASLGAQDVAIADQVTRIGHVFFTGGDQAQILAALAPQCAESVVLTAIREVHAAGGLLAGSSAGAAIMSDPMLLGGTSLEAAVHGIADDPAEPGLLVGQGLGFFPFGLIDQHFIKRGRHGRLIVALAATGQRLGFGIDENTALFVEGATARVVGEYGVVLIDLENAEIDDAAGQYDNIRVSYLDDGDTVDLVSREVSPGSTKRTIAVEDVAYRAPIHTRRHVFGAYTLYDLTARLVLGDPATYTEDCASAFDPRSGTEVSITLARTADTRLWIETSDSGFRMTALGLGMSMIRNVLSAEDCASRQRLQPRRFGAEVSPKAQMVFLGSSPTRSAPEMLAGALELVGKGPVGVLAAASAEPRDVAEEHISLLASQGITATDLGVTIDTVEFAAQNTELLDQIGKLTGLLVCGGNQIRLVETLLHRGEESALLGAIACAHARGMPLIAASGAASAMSGLMIAGGSSYEALRYGVASDVGHPGLVIQEGVGLFGGGIVDQNLIGGQRLGRLIVACAEESERYGIGVFEDSAVIASHNGARLRATGRDGFVLVEIDTVALELQSDSFVAKGIRLTVLSAGDEADLVDGTIKRCGPSDKAQAILARLIEDIAEDISELADGHAVMHGISLRMGVAEAASVMIDLECARDEFS
ncbi:MAG: cyanophycinase [Sedimentitalea sp.]|uniref:cyanophycinase n=1 Tax=Sedimentitalea sp. TaxID=2048915 RepID=UPI0032655329